MKKTLSKWMTQNRTAGPMLDGEVREVVLDVARHPARDLFLDHHSELHRSPIVTI